MGHIPGDINPQEGVVMTRVLAQCREVYRLGVANSIVPSTHTLPFVGNSALNTPFNCSDGAGASQHDLPMTEIDAASETLGVSEDVHCS